MDRPVYRFTFKPDVSLEEVEATLVLAFFSAESLHGDEQVRLDASHTFDHVLRQCIISAETDVGRDVVRLFTGYLRREFASDAFTVQRLQSVQKGLSERS